MVAEARTSATEQEQPRRSRLRALAGHLWSVLPPLLGRKPRGVPDSHDIRAVLRDPAVGTITLRAAHHEVQSATSVVVIVHGIAGNADAGYCLRAARSAVQAGFSAVRVSLRGADGNGDDIYHATLTDDLRVILAAPALRRYRQVFLMGYSQGGNMAMRAAAERIDPRIAGVVAICPPLDLARVMSNFDRKRYRPIKLIMNREANRQYERVERRGRASATVAELRRAKSCDEWNELTIVRRFGFRNVGYYYDASSAPRIWRRLTVPTLVAASQYDPMVPADSLERLLADAPPSVETVWLDCGGHLHFPRSVNLGEDCALGLENQCMGWFIRNQQTAAHWTAVS